MRPAARIQAAIDVLAQVEQDIEAARPTAAARLASWGRAARYAGAKDRRAVSDLVYAALRRRGSFLWAAQSEHDAPAARARMLAAALLTEAGHAPAALAEEVFTGDRHAPEALSGAETTHVSAVADRLAAPEAALKDFPDALRAELARSTADPAAEIRALRERGAADLRANRLKAPRARALDRLIQDGVAATPGPLAPTAIRLAAPARLAGVGAFEDGWVEPQDAASQAAALLAEAAPGETTLDYCAGGGGKTLALGAEMGGAGRLFAYDVDAARLEALPARARRAGLDVALVDAAGLGPLRSAADLVFVDAPCSGSGAWARNPDAKWTTGAARLKALAAAQRDALDAAATFVRPGGRLVYATCSLFAAENLDQVAAFLARRPDFSLGDLSGAWARAGLAGAPPPGPSAHAGATLIPPSQYRTEGFFVAIIQRSGSAAA